MGEEMPGTKERLSSDVYNAEIPDEIKSAVWVGELDFSKGVDSALDQVIVEEPKPPFSISFMGEIIPSKTVEKVMGEEYGGDNPIFSNEELATGLIIQDAKYELMEKQAQGNDGILKQIKERRDFIKTTIREVLSGDETTSLLLDKMDDATRKLNMFLADKRVKVTGLVLVEAMVLAACMQGGGGEVMTPTDTGVSTGPTPVATEVISAEPTFVPEEIVITPTPPDVNSFVPAVNPPEYQASGGEYSQGAEAVAENNFYKSVYGLYTQEEGAETFDSEELFREAMDEYLVEKGLTVMQSESPVEGQVLSLITSKDLKSFYAYVTSEGAMRTSRLDIGDNESTLHKFDLPNGTSLGMTWKQEGGVENAYYFAVDEASGQAVAWINTSESTTDKLDLRLVGDGDYTQVESFARVGGVWTAKSKEGEDLFTFDVEARAWKEVKVDPNYGYIAPEVWGEESLPLVKEWWEGYKEKMPTNEDIKWMTYGDGSRVEMGEIPGLRSGSSRTFGVIIGELFDFPDSIDPSDYEQMLLTFLPTNPEKVEEAGNIVPVRITTDSSIDNFVVSLGILSENGAIKENLRWNYVDIAYNMLHGDLLRFLRAGLNGESPPLYGCQLAVSLAGSDNAAETKYIRSLYSEEGDGEWEVGDTRSPALIPQGHGIFTIPESCMTEELWEVFRSLPNDPR